MAVVIIPIAKSRDIFPFRNDGNGTVKSMMRTIDESGGGMNLRRQVFLIVATVSRLPPFRVTSQWLDGGLETVATSE